MKKICLLTITSFCAVLAFSQSAVQTVPGQPKPGRAVAAKTATSATTLTTVDGAQKTTPVIITKGSAVIPVASTIPLDASQNSMSLPQAQKAAEATKTPYIKPTAKTTKTAVKN